MITQAKGIEENRKREEWIHPLPFSTIDVKLSPDPENVSLAEIEDSLYLMVDAIERAMFAVCQLDTDAENASPHRKGMTPEEVTMNRYTLACHSSILLPLIVTQLEALRMTGSVLAENLKQKRRNT